LCNLNESNMASLLNLLLASFLAMGAAPAPAAQAATATAPQATPPAGKNADEAARAAQEQFQRKFLARVPANHGKGLPR
jgi:ribosomal protein L12E/L44/L45/RPP1/RPP2